jgi:hypothetical protein
MIGKCSLAWALCRAARFVLLKGWSVGRLKNKINFTSTIQSKTNAKEKE